MAGYLRPPNTAALRVVGAMLSADERDALRRFARRTMLVPSPPIGAEARAIARVALIDRPALVATLTQLRRAARVAQGVAPGQPEREGKGQ